MVGIKFWASRERQDSARKPSLRVLVIAQFSAVGGTRTYLQLLLDLLKILGAQIVLVADTDCEANYANVQTDYPQISIYWLNNRSTRLSAGFPKCLLTMLLSLQPALLSQHYDLVIVSAGTPERWLETLFLPLPVLYILHTYPMWGRGARRLSRLFWFLIQRNLSLHKRLVTVSCFSRRVIREQWFHNNLDENRIEVAYNPSRYSSNEVSSSDDKQHNHKTFTILTVGHLENYKNPSFWVDIALTTKALAPEAEIEFIWVGSGSLLQQYRDYLHPYSWIRLVGECSDPRPYYEQTSVYLQPSLVESQGIAVLEAATFGIPAIVSNCGGLPESVIDGETGYVLPLDTPWTFAEIILKLLHNPALRYQLGKAAKKRYQEIFDRSHWFSHMQKLINNTICSHK